MKYASNLARKISEPGDPKSGQILIRVQHAPIKDSDLLVASGLYAVQPKLPSVVGNEGAGKVLAVGDGVQNVKVSTRSHVALQRSESQGGRVGGFRQSRDDTGTQLVMIMSHRWLRAAGMVMILASLGVAGDTPGIPANFDRAAAPPSCDDRPGQDPAALEMRRPYECGKVPVVFVHGLWGRPQLWDRMVESLEADPVLRKRYQFWTFRYASGDPIPFSAHLLRQSLRQARRRLDPAGTDAAFDRMVIVGHSLGGILTKMLVQRSGARPWQTVCARPIDQVGGPPKDCRLLQEEFCYEPAPEVRRVVFIATPHRGSPLASGRLRELGTRLCWRPSRFLEACEAVLANNGPDAFTPGYLEEYPTSVDELAPGHPFLMGLCDLGIDSSVRSHSIIADLRNPPGPGATDGIVPYSSSHLEGVASELLVRGLHICLDHPAVIRELRRILVEHAQDQPPTPTDHQAPRRLEKSQRLGLRYGVGGASEIQRGNPRGSLIEVQP